jgi:hypothetical protein
LLKGHRCHEVAEAGRSTVAEEQPTRGAAVPPYLTKFSMTPEAWAKLIKEPEDRREAVGRLLEAAGGKLHGYWYAFGDHNGYALGEAPDNTAEPVQQYGCCAASP